jgi:hypothetical protein
MTEIPKIPVEKTPERKQEILYNQPKREMGLLDAEIKEPVQPKPIEPLPSLAISRAN